MTVKLRKRRENSNQNILYEKIYFQLKNKIYGRTKEEKKRQRKKKY